MLYTFLLTLMIVDGLVLGAVVLLQAGQGGGLASLGGGTTDLVMGGRQAVTILQQASWITRGPRSYRDPRGAVRHRRSSGRSATGAPPAEEAVSHASGSVVSG